MEPRRQPTLQCRRRPPFPYMSVAAESQSPPPERCRRLPLQRTTSTAQSHPAHLRSRRLLPALLAIGHGWAEAAPSPTLSLASRGSTALWVLPLPATFLEAATTLQSGPTRTAMSGSWGALDTTPTAPLLASLTTFGSSILQRTSGHGWAEARLRQPVPVSVGKRACTAQRERLLPQTPPEAETALKPGSTSAAICGSLEGMPSMPMEPSGS